MSNIKFIARAEAGLGWRIWNRKTKRSWGNYFKDYPEDVLNELNGSKDQENLINLCKKSYTKNEKS